MEGILVFVMIIVFVAVRYANETKRHKAQAEERQRRAMRDVAVASGGAKDVEPPRQPQRLQPRVQPAAHSTPAMSGSMPYESTEGQSFGGSIPYESTLGQSFGGSMSYESTQGQSFSGSMSYESTQGYSLSGHGASTSAAARKRAAGGGEGQHENAYHIPETEAPRAFAFTLDRYSVKKGFLYGEILGKPKALRR